MARGKHAHFHSDDESDEDSIVVPGANMMVTTVMS